MSRKDLPTIKVCVLGETGVGKTCLSNKLTFDLLKFSFLDLYIKSK